MQGKILTFVTALVLSASAFAGDEGMNGFISGENLNSFYKYENRDLVEPLDRKNDIGITRSEVTSPKPRTGESFNRIKDGAGEQVVVRKSEGSRERVAELISKTTGASPRKSYVQFSSKPGQILSYTNCAKVSADVAKFKMEKSEECRTYDHAYCQSLVGKDAGAEARLRSLQECENAMKPLIEVDAYPYTQEAGAIERLNIFFDDSKALRGTKDKETPKETNRKIGAYQQLRRFIVDTEFCKKYGELFQSVSAGSNLPPAPGSAGTNSPAAGSTRR